jgi:hypothetical protein
MIIVTTKHQTAREALLASVTVAPEVMARRWEPFSPEALSVLREWSDSGEFARTLEAIHADSDSLDQ